MVKLTNIGLNDLPEELSDIQIFVDGFDAKNKTKSSEIIKIIEHLCKKSSLRFNIEVLVYRYT